MQWCNSSYIGHNPHHDSLTRPRAITDELLMIRMTRLCCFHRVVRIEIKLIKTEAPLFEPSSYILTLLLSLTLN